MYGEVLTNRSGQPRESLTPLYCFACTWRWWEDSNDSDLPVALAACTAADASGGSAHGGACRMDLRYVRRRYCVRVVLLDLLDLVVGPRVHSTM